MLTFEDDLIKKVLITSCQFLSQLLRKHQAQLNQIDSHQSATFYLWFDEQALQLRFNLLFGSDLTLPFRSKINVIDSPNPILKDFITTRAYLLLQKGMLLNSLNLMKIKMMMKKNMCWMFLLKNP